MATWFWTDVPLMVLAFTLTTGLSYAILLGGRRKTQPAASATPEQSRATSEEALAPSRPPRSSQTSPRPQPSANCFTWPELRSPGA